ncbi:MAG: DUF1847 domain-containing protein [Firmicutes bacterium]|nr:DUF1847 domain-containing protein [Bacillota bacterium]
MCDEIKRSCIDCMGSACEDDDNDMKYPPFCMHVNMKPELRAESVEKFRNNEEFLQMSMQSAAVESEGYGVWPRVKEICEFAKRMGYKKIGIATCVGLLAESRAMAKLLRHYGFEVVGISCKSGQVTKQEIGYTDNNCGLGDYICNPILQATVLNDEKTDMNIIMGLCVGHDTLFIKHSDAPITVGVTKDRVTGHNPVQPLYQLNSYYSKLLK